MSDVGQIAEAVGWLAKVAYEVLHKSEQERIDEAYHEASKSVESFKDHLLKGDMHSVQLALDGLMFGIKTDISPSEFTRLRAKTLGSNFDAYDLLGLYQRAIGAEFAQKVVQILTAKEK